MSGNIPVVTTTFEAGLQAKINAVGSNTTIEDIIALVRAGELIDSIDNTTIQTELQLRMDAVDVNTDADKYIELAAAYGKVTNDILDISSDIKGMLANVGGGSLIQTRVNPTTITLRRGTPLTITPPVGSRIKLTLLFTTGSVPVVVKVGSKTVITDRLYQRSAYESLAGQSPQGFHVGGSEPSLLVNNDTARWNNSVAVDPLLGGVDEVIEVSQDTNNDYSVVYSYEVWK